VALKLTVEMTCMAARPPAPPSHAQHCSTVHQVSPGGLFADNDMSSGYARARPPLHSKILDRARSRLGLVEPVNRALDVGCGAGLSTRALQAWAHNCIGLDPAAEMIGEAKGIAPEASFLVGSAESFPVRSGSCDLLSAAGSLDYVDLDRCLDEATRVLAPHGRLVVYDFSTGRPSRCSDELDLWYSELLARWPAPVSGHPRVDLETLAAGNLTLAAVERFTVEALLGLDAYVDYIMTETNIADATQTGEPRADIRTWCESGLSALFHEPQEITFEAYVCVLLRRP
jgi:trans-aconitate methyltransferase